LNTACFRASDQPLVQNRSPDSDSYALREFSDNLRVSLQEADSAEPMACVGPNFDAEFAKCGNRFGHQAFAAGFVNRRLGAVRDDDGHSALPHRNGSRKTSWPATNYKHVHFCFAGDHS
jgi:hypothetical protein